MDCRTASSPSIQRGAAKTGPDRRRPDNCATEAARRNFTGVGRCPTSIRRTLARMAV
jgi:hypothetical protein